MSSPGGPLPSPPSDQDHSCLNSTFFFTLFRLHYSLGDVVYSRSDIGRSPGGPARMSAEESKHALLRAGRGLVCQTLLTHDACAQCTARERIRITTAQYAHPGPNISAGCGVVLVSVPDQCSMGLVLKITFTPARWPSSRSRTLFLKHLVTIACRSDTIRVSPDARMRASAHLRFAARCGRPSWKRWFFAHSSHGGGSRQF